MATYYLIVDNPPLYNQKGKVHGNSPWNKPKGYRFEITGRPITSESGRLIMPLGDGTWLDADDIRLVTDTPPTEPPPPSVKPIYLTAHYEGGGSERYVPE